MVSKTTKSIASRVPVDIYFQLKNEADALEMNMNDYLLKILKARNEKTEVAALPEPVKVKVKKEKAAPPIPKPKKVKVKPVTGMAEILFPDMD
jgi:hypothetical protein